MVTQTKPEPQKQMVFECSQCGECCGTVNLPIENDKRETLLKKEWVQKRLESYCLEFIDIDNDISVMPLKPDKTCVFLDEEKRCLIQKHEGRELKPDTCKFFPFAATTMPDKSFGFDVSASCKSVAERYLETFDAIVPQSNEDFTLDQEIFPQKIQVTRFKKIDYDTYQKFHDHIYQLFIHPDYKPEQILKTLHACIKHLPRTDFDTIDPKKYVDFTFHPRWEALLITTYIRKSYGTATLANIVFKKQYHEPNLFGSETIDMRWHKEVEWDQAFDSHFKAYLLNVMRRKVLISFGHTQLNLLLLTTLAYFMIQWYAKTLAHMQSRQKTVREDLNTAFRIVERYYTGHNPEYLDIFRRSRAGGLWLDFMYGKT